MPLCPIDQHPLTPSSVGSDEVMRCEKCGGSLLKIVAYGLAQADERGGYCLSSSVKPLPGGRVLRGPLTGNQMQEVRYRGVRLDIDLAGGHVWLDQGEWTLLLQNLRRRTPTGKNPLGDALGGLLDSSVIVEGLVEFFSDVFEGV